MAERVGFEPTVPVKVQQFSRLPDSTTLAPLREATILGFTGIVFKLSCSGGIFLTTSFHSLGTSSLQSS